MARPSKDAIVIEKLPFKEAGSKYDKENVC